MSKELIRVRILEVEKAKFKRQTEVLREANKPFNEALRHIQHECGETGHEWEFSHYNWDGSYRWDKCKWCGAGEGADKHEQRDVQDMGG